MITPRAIFAVLACLLSAAVVAQTPPGRAARAQGATTVLIIRHAEKSTLDPKDRDPDLAPEGVARAERFAAERADLALDAIYVTQYKRTQQTAAPIAKRRSLTPIVVPVESEKVNAWCEDIVQRATQAPPPGDAPARTILVVTHSDVVGPLIAAFGVGPVEEPKGFGDMWTITLAPGEKPAMTIGRYADGPPTQDRRGEQR